MLAKATQQSKLDEVVSTEDKEILLQALRSWGALDRDYAYKASLISADFRGYAKDPGGGLAAGERPVAGDPVNLSDILKSRLWRYLQSFAAYQFQTTMFQPVGGMDMIGKAFAREVGDLITYDAKVIRIQQNDHGVSVSYVNSKTPDTPQLATADWCVCTIPLSILSQIPIDVGSAMKAAIDAVPYAASVKIGLQFKRRFWEEDEAIYGGISYTDLPIRQISYPSTASIAVAAACCLAAISLRAPTRSNSPSMAPAERVAHAVEFGSRLHPQYKAEFENGIAVAWHRVPFTLGLCRRMDRAGEGTALRQSLPDRRQDRPGRRTCLLHSGVAGRRDPFVARCDLAAASACCQDLTSCAQPGPKQQGEIRGSVAASRDRRLSAWCHVAVIASAVSARTNRLRRLRRH